MIKSHSPSVRYILLYFGKCLGQRL